MSTLPNCSSVAASKLFERSAIADIRGHAQRLASARFDFRGGFVHLLLAAAGGDHIGAGLGEAETHGATDSRCTAGYNCDFAFEAEKL